MASRHCQITTGQANSYDHGRASAFNRLGQPAEALKDWRRTVELSEGQSHPNYRQYRPRALARLGEHARATAEVDVLLGEEKVPASMLNEFASAYALSFSAALEDTKLIDPERSLLSEKYAAGAVGLLAKAQAAGFFQTAVRIENLKKSTTFAPLRERHDFQKLLTELEKTPKTTIQ